MGKPIQFAAQIIKMNTVRFTIPGKPVPLQRARIGKYGSFYTPQKSLRFQKKVHLFAKAAGLRKTSKSIGIFAVFYRADRVRVDIDNYTKNLLDGLRYFFNDCQVISLEVHKNHCESKKEERTEVVVNSFS